MKPNNMKSHSNITRREPAKGWFVSFAVLAFAIALVAASMLTTSPAAQGASAPAAKAGSRDVASWSGYWTWDTKNKAWFWTWVWIPDGKPWVTS